MGSLAWVLALAATATCAASCSLIDLEPLQSGSSGGAASTSTSSTSSTATGTSSSESASSSTGMGGAPPMTKPRLYVVGGRATISAPEPTIFEAEFDPDGSLSAWTTETMPAKRQNHVLAVVDGTMFVIGGIDPADLDSALAGAMDADGHFLGWSLLPAVLPSPFGRAGAGVHGKDVYIVGGRQNGGGTELDAIVRATASGPTLSTFQSAATLPFATGDTGVVVLGDQLLSVGGQGMAAGALLRAPIDPATGALGAVVNTTALAVPRDLHCMATGVVGGETRVYVAGGEDASGKLLGSVEFATLSGGTLGAFTLSSVSFTPRRALACALVGEKLYVVGGVVVGAGTTPSTDEVTRFDLDPTTGLPTAATLDRPLPEARGFHQVIVLDVPAP